MPTMKRCPACDAPNPTGRTLCFSCQQPPDQPAPRALSPTLPGRVCPNCGTTVPATADRCPICGRNLEPYPDAGLPLQDIPRPSEPDTLRRPLVTPPSNWTASTGVDGTLHLTRTTLSRILQNRGFWIAIPIAIYFLFRTGSMARMAQQMDPQLQPSIGPFVGLMLLVTVGGFLSLAIYTRLPNELLVAHDRLEVGAQRLGGLPHVHANGAILVLEVKRRFTSRYNRLLKQLYVESVAGRAVLEEANMGLFSGMFRSGDVAVDLAAFLSQQTGWRIVDRTGGVTDPLGWITGS